MVKRDGYICDAQYVSLYIKLRYYNALCLGCDGALLLLVIVLYMDCVPMQLVT